MMMRTYARNILPRRLIQAALACLLLSALFATEAQAAITTTLTSSPTFFTHSTIGGRTPPQLNPICNYVSFNVSSTIAINDAWATIGAFAGGFLALGGGDDGLTHFGPMAAGETKQAFFYICSTYTAGGTSVAQTFNVTTYSGNPLAGGVLQSTTPFSMLIDDSMIQANPNTVNAIWADINPSILGATTTLTVDGDTGSMGCTGIYSTCGALGGGGPLAFTPAAFTDWRADAYELVAVGIVLSLGNTGTYNSLYINQVPSAQTTHYTATYYFRPVATTASTTTLSPIAFLPSGNPLKHTALNSGVYNTGGLLPILPAENKVLLVKSVSHATLPAQGGVVTYTISASNGGAYALSLDSFNDVLPAGVTYVPGSTTYNGVSFADPVISGPNVTWSSFFTIPAGTTRTLVFQATLPATPGTYTNSVTARIGNAIIDTTLATSDNVPATASTIVLKAPTLSEAFSPTALAVGGTSTLTLTITNPNAAHTLYGIAVSDTLPAAPAGLVFSSPTGVATTCPGAVLGVAGTTLSITGGTLTAGQSCTVSVNVTSTVNNVIYTNITGAVTSDNGGTGLTASATVEFSPKPTITKSFSVSSIPRNGTATLTFTITNNTAAALASMTFDDLFPPGLVTANPPASSPVNPCGGTLSSWNGTAAGALSGTGGDAGFRLTNGAIATAGGTCTFSINVTSAAAGIYANTTGGVSATAVTAGPVSNTATLTVMDGPTVAKALSPSTIGKGQTATLTITLSNANAAAITGASFTDSYPLNVTTAAIPNASTTCASGSVVSAAGSVSLSGAIIPAGGSCTVSIDVTSATAGIYTNTIAAAAVTTTNAGSNAAPASATLTVNTTPTIAKSFTFNPVTGVSTMNITITNNDAAAITALSFTDLFPTGMTTANPPTVTPAFPCGAGSSIQSWNGIVAGALTATGGNPGIKLTAGQLAAAGGTCTFSINLVVDSVGVYSNQTSASTSSLGTGSPSNIASWIAPAVSKTFTPTQVTPTTVGPSEISRMIITITNPSLTTSLTGLSITDIFPATGTQIANGNPTATGLRVVFPPTPNSVLPATNCAGGVLTDAAGAALAAGSLSVKMAGATLAPGSSCTIAVDVNAIEITPAVYVNTTGKVSSNQGIGNSGSDTLNITTSPTIKKSFLTSPVTLAAGTASSVMRISIQNNYTTAITSVLFSDTFPTSPAPMTLANPLTVVNGCGGTLTNAAGLPLAVGSNSIKLTGGAIALGATCIIDVTVSVSAPGSYSNTTTGATSNKNTVVGPTSNTAILVAQLAAPTVTKTFASPGFQVNGSDKLTITLTNPNTTAITGVTFTDIYPVNMLNAASPALTNSCGGTATAAPSTGSMSLSGGTIPASGSCILTVDVTATAVGLYTNTLPIGAVSSDNANAGPGAAVSSSATAYLPPALSKAFGTATLASGGNTALTLTLTNPASNLAALTGVQVDDSFPGGLTLQNTAFTYTPAACGTVTKTTGAASAAGDNNIRFVAASLAVGASCQVSINVTSISPGAITNTTNVPIATGPAPLTGTPAWADLTVSNAPSITLLKTVAIHSDPVNLLVNPKFIPGALAQFTIIASNSGGPADNDSTLVTDPVPANTALFVDIAGAGPVLFSQGATSSTMTYTYTALGNPADDIAFSNDGGATWTAVPAAGADGCDATITHIRVNPKGTFIGGTPNPSFQLTFRVCVQ